jgi:uncharacterized protein (DUF58 family)
MSLSRLTLMLVSLIILLAIIGIWMGEPLNGLWRWPAVLLILAVAWERFRLTTRYTIERQLAKTLALGETAHYTLTLNNQSAARLILETQADYPSSLSAENSLQNWQMPGHDSQSRLFALTPVQLGATTLGTLYLKQLGAFGLCWWTRVLDDHVSINVEPVRLDHKMRLSGLGAIGNRQHRQAGSGVELLDLRDYQAGDPLRSMDWKATARRGKAIVRRFERERRLEIVILIDCGRGSRMHCGQLDRLHNYVNVAAQLTEFAALQGDRIACLAYAQQVVAIEPMTSGLKGVKHIRRLLGRLAASNEAGNALNAALEVKRLLKHRGLVIILTEMEQPEAALQLLQASQVLAAKHQVLVAVLTDPTLNTVLKHPAKHWQDPYRQFATLEYQRGRELTQRRLQRAGVAIISATADQLDKQVLAYYQAKREKIGAS